jgi:hypothetical protein
MVITIVSDSVTLLFASGNPNFSASPLKRVCICFTRVARISMKFHWRVERFPIGMIGRVGCLIHTVSPWIFMKFIQHSYEVSFNTEQFQTWNARKNLLFVLCGSLKFWRSLIEHRARISDLNLLKVCHLVDAGCGTFLLSWIVWKIQTLNWVKERMGIIFCQKGDSPEGTPGSPLIKMFVAWKLESPKRLFWCNDRIYSLYRKNIIKTILSS